MLLIISMVAAPLAIAAAGNVANALLQGGFFFMRASYAQGAEDGVNEYMREEGDRKRDWYKTGYADGRSDEREGR